jgi:hypothetical protein
MLYQLSYKGSGVRLAQTSGQENEKTAPRGNFTFFLIAERFARSVAAC